VSYEFARKLGLKVAILENRERRFVKPTEQSCAAALSAAEPPANLRFFMPDPPGPDAYPIVTFSWILLYSRYEDAEKARQSEIFSDGVSWAASRTPPKWATFAYAARRRHGFRGDYSLPIDTAEPSLMSAHRASVDIGP